MKSHMNIYNLKFVNSFLTILRILLKLNLPKLNSKQLQASFKNSLEL